MLQLGNHGGLTVQQPLSGLQVRPKTRLRLAPVPLATTAAKYLERDCAAYKRNVTHTDRLRVATGRVKQLHDNTPQTGDTRRQALK
jgi:hypothetical protein